MEAEGSGGVHGEPDHDRAVPCGRNGKTGFPAFRFARDATAPADTESRRTYDTENARPTRSVGPDDDPWGFVKGTADKTEVHTPAT
jgi:hypothetical protein